MLRVAPSGFAGLPKGSSTQRRSNTGLQVADYRYFFCHMCSKNYMQKKDLIVHLKNIHGDHSQQVQCHVCLKSYKNQESLRVHLKCKTWTHVAVDEPKPENVCYICNASFSWKRSLKLHIHNMHGKDARPFSCPICGIILKNRQSLKNHMNGRHKKR
ncbi:hypothetical protein B566_EDAN018144 [Ephemera danica]|nr:hypothetical protein B566_EDAN018144 [Ephemera danica]